MAVEYKKVNMCTPNLCMSCLGSVGGVHIVQQVSREHGRPIREHIHEQCFLEMLNGAIEYFEQEERNNNDRSEHDDTWEAAEHQGNPEDRPN